MVRGFGCRLKLDRPILAPGFLSSCMPSKRMMTRKIVLLLPSLVGNHHCIKSLACFLRCSFPDKHPKKPHIQRKHNECIFVLYSRLYRKHMRATVIEQEKGPGTAGAKNEGMGRRMGLAGRGAARRGNNE